VQQILVALVIILKRRTKPTERALITTAGIVLVTTARITTIERMLVALGYKKGSKDRYYRLY
jgi:hypothetical protein